MKPNIKSPYFYLFIVSIVVFFGQAIIISKTVQHQVQNTSKATGSLVFISIGIGLILSGLAALFYFKTTKLKQTRLNQLLVFFITSLVLSPFIAFFIVAMSLLPNYGLVK